MSTINELNEKIAELEKQRDALAEAEKTGGFKVGDKVVIEGVVSEIGDSYNYLIEVKMKSGQYGYFQPDHLRHADEEPAPTGDGDCDSVDWTDDAENWGRALNEACFAFMEAVPDPAEQSMWRSGMTALRAAILKYAALVQAAKGGDVATDHIVEPNKMAVATKGGGPI